MELFKEQIVIWPFAYNSFLQAYFMKAEGKFSFWSLSVSFSILETKQN